LLKGAIGILLGDIAYAKLPQGKTTSDAAGVSATPELT
jgi:hypothetical protein